MSLSGRALNSSDVYGAVNASAIGTKSSTSAPMRSAESRPRASRQSLNCANLSCVSMSGATSIPKWGCPGAGCPCDDTDVKPSAPLGRGTSGLPVPLQGPLLPQHSCGSCARHGLGGWPGAAPRLEPGTFWADFEFPLGIFLG